MIGVKEIQTSPQLLCCLQVPSLKLLFKYQKFHKRVTSDILGNPHAFDNELISLYNTLPEPSNFNMVWTSIEYKEPIVIQGQLPIARLNSLSIYCRKEGSTVPSSIDLSPLTDAKGKFEVIIAPGNADHSRFKKDITVISSSDWDRGFVCIRNYLVPDGLFVATPVISRLADGKVLRQSEVLISGPANLENIFHAKTLQCQRSRYCLILFSFAINAYYSDHSALTFDFVHRTCWITCAVILITFFLSYAWSQLLFVLGKQRLLKQTKFCRAVNVFYLPSDAQAEASSQPCSLHKYWIMKYDVPPGAELSLKTIINPADQKYWYDKTISIEYV